MPLPLGKLIQDNADADADASDDAADADSNNDADADAASDDADADASDTDYADLSEVMCPLLLSERSDGGAVDSPSKTIGFR